MSDHLKRKERPGLKRKPDTPPRVKPVPLVNYVIPNEFKQCFCNNCWDMYHNTKYPSQNHIILRIDPSASQADSALMMPLLKAWGAFLEDFTGYPVTFTVGGLEPIKSGWKGRGEISILTPPNLFLNGETEIMPRSHTFDVYIAKRSFEDHQPVAFPLAPEPTPDDRTAASFAYTRGGRDMLMKSNFLTDFARTDPGFALAIMVHEATAHRFDRLFENLTAREKAKDFKSPGLKYRLHYTDPLGGGHCGEPTCINAFLDRGRPNHRKLSAFFEQYYNNNHNRPLTLSHEFFSDEPEGYTNATFKIPEPHEIYQIKETGYGAWLNPEEDDPELEALDIRLGLREKDEEDEAEASGSRYKPLGRQDDDVFVGA